MLFTANDADGMETEVFPRCGGSVDMVGPGAAKSEQGFDVMLSGTYQVVFQLAPLVATEQRVDQVVAFDVEPDFGMIEEVTLKSL